MALDQTVSKYFRSKWNGTPISSIFEDKEKVKLNSLDVPTNTKQLDFSANLEPIKDLKIDVVGNRAYYENYTENYRVNDTGSELEYESLTPNTFGNFNISTLLIKTAFSKSDETSSDAFSDFRSNRLVIANRLAQEFYGSTTYPTDAEGFPVGFGKNNQKVLLPAFLAAYSGQDASKVKTTAFRDVPIPNILAVTPATDLLVALTSCNTCYRLACCTY